MAERTEMIQVSGIRCERCVARLGGALQDAPGLHSARATLMGQVTLSWDDELTDRDTLLAAMARAGFRIDAKSSMQGLSPSNTFVP